MKRFMCFYNKRERERELWNLVSVCLSWQREESLERMQQEEEEARQKEMETTEDEEDSLEDLVKVINYGNTVRPTQGE